MTAKKPRLQEQYETQVAPKLGTEFDVTNRFAQPKLQKIVISVGLGRQLEGTKLKPVAKEQVLQDLALIAGQKPVMVKAKKSVANFKVREGYETGAMVTLRGTRMWEFFDRLITFAIPQVKDFRGLSAKSFDPAGNYSFGITEQGIFPEVDMAAARFTFGMHVTFVWENSAPDKTKFAMAELGFPFKKPPAPKKDKTPAEAAA